MVEGACRFVTAAQSRQRPRAAELRRREAGLSREYLIVCLERGGGVLPGDGHAGKTEPAFGRAGIGRGGLSIRLIGAVEVAEVKTHEPQRVQRLDVARPAPNRFLQTRRRLLRLAPVGASQPAFARPLRRERRRCGRPIVRVERLVVPMRQLERAAQLDVRRGVVLGQPRGQRLHLSACFHHVAGRGQHPHQEPARGDVFFVGPEPIAKDGDRLAFPILAHQRFRLLDRVRRRASLTSGENEPKHDMPLSDHRRHRIMVALEDIRRIGVLGAGQMGAGIAQVASAAELEVVLLDATLDKAVRAKEKIANVLARQVAKAKMTNEARQALLDRIEPESATGALSRCDFVIEAVSEDLDLKIAVLKACDLALAPGKWLASNTSSLSLTRLAAATSRPDRVIGMHFMNPPALMQLVEVVRAVQTRDETYELTKRLAQKMGKTVTTSADAPGFLVNRILIPLLCEACFALQEGVGSAKDIDLGAKLGLNHPMGPLELSDLIGLDTVLAISDVLHSETGDSKYRAPTLLRNLVAAGWLGRKTGRGFYVYDQTRDGR